jgi:ankyrin repeat protein
MFNTLLACKKFSLLFSKPLHWAAKMGKVEVVNAILGNQEEQEPFFMNRTCPMTVGKKSRIGRRYRFATQFIRWDGSKIGPFDLVSFTPLQLASVHGHKDVVKALCNDEKGRLGAMIENFDGVTALQIATESQYDEIVKILTDLPEVAKDVKRLYRDRQVHVDAANAIDCKCDFRWMATTAFRVLYIRWKCKH